MNGTYSLSGVNTALAAALEAERPGRVRVVPVEGEPTSAIARVPAPCRATTARLAGRPAFATGPEIVVSQHYPVHAPPLPGDLPLALFYWEESLVPAETVAALNRSFRGVLAPSRFVAKALRNSGVHVPVRLLPPAPALAAFEAIGRQRQPRVPDAVFTFLHVSSGFPRKGVDALLAAYARAFRAGDKVRLILKTFPNPHNDVADQVAELSARDPDHAEIRVIDQDLSRDAMLDLYRGADAAVLPTRGEGYNLPAAEAMAAGVPLIVTGYGGHRDFCGPDEARLIGWNFAASGSHLATAGSIWVEPEVDDLADALRDAIANPAAASARAARAQSRITAATRPAATASHLDAIALDLLLAPPAEKARVAWISSWDVRCGIADYSRYLLDALPREGMAELVILADHRTAAAATEGRVRTAWRAGDLESAPALARAVAQEDPHVVVVQHQPGLLPWAGLVALLDDAALSARASIVGLHNTAHLLDISGEEQAAVLRALAKTSRILVHTLADLNRLAGLGLLDNVALLPHGAPAPRPRRPARDLPRAAPVLIGSYGFFLPAKGLPELVAALPELRRTWPQARLRLVNADYGVGDSAEEIARCRRLAHEAGLEGAVEFCTEFLPHERSLDLLAECDLIALPYQASKEASSAAMRTALASGAPVAVSPLPIFDEAEQAASRLPGTSPAAIAAGLTALLESVETRDALTEAAQLWLRARRWDLVGTRLAGMIRGLAGMAAR